MLASRTVRSPVRLAKAHEAAPAPHDERITAQSTLPEASGRWPLLLALNFAHGLPPDAIVPPGPRAWPTIVPRDRPLVGAAAVAAVLSRPAVALGLGRVMLRDVDVRLGGLIASLDVLRVLGRGNALVVVSRIEPEGGTSEALTDNLWRLARAAVQQHAPHWEPLDDLEKGAFLAIYGQTAQVVWRSAEAVATVSVCGLDADAAGLVQDAWAVASLVVTIDVSRWCDHGPIGSGLPSEDGAGG